MRNVKKFILIVGVFVVTTSCGSKSDLSFLPSESSVMTNSSAPQISTTTLDCGLSRCDEGEELIVTPTTVEVVLPRCVEYAYNDLLPLEYCQEGRGIQYAQNILVSLGYDIEADSYLGPASFAAVRDFQEKNGLPVTGKIDSNTWRALDPDQKSFPGYDRNGDGLVTPDEFGE